MVGDFANIATRPNRKDQTKATDVAKQPEGTGIHGL